jgi:hypothetical protein
MQREITDDYSMGYGSINGFRASVGLHFIGMTWRKNSKQSLLLHPFVLWKQLIF